MKRMIYTIHYTLFTLYYMARYKHYHLTCPLWQLAHTIYWMASIIAIMSLCTMPYSHHVITNKYAVAWMLINIAETTRFTVNSEDIFSGFGIKDTIITYLVISISISIALFCISLKPNIGTGHASLVLLGYMMIIYTISYISVMNHMHTYIKRVLHARWSVASHHERMAMTRNPKVIGAYTQSLMLHMDNTP